MRTCSMLAVLVLLSVVSCGCRPKPMDYGNFAKADSAELVQDAMSAMLANYPPAKSRLVLVVEATDSFGTSLLETMRKEGYAIAEPPGPNRRDKYLPVGKKPDGEPFGYVLDHIGKDDELRVTLHVGGESLSRLYRVQRSGDALQYLPQGFWTRKQ